MSDPKPTVAKATRKKRAKGSDTGESPSNGSGLVRLDIPCDVREALRTVINWIIPGVNGEEVGVIPATCCDDVCKNTPAGKTYLVVCDGTTMKTLVGTQDGQYPAWDHKAGTWVLANI